MCSRPVPGGLEQRWPSMSSGARHAVALIARGVDRKRLRHQRRRRHGRLGHQRRGGHRRVGHQRRRYRRVGNWREDTVVWGTSCTDPDCEPVIWKGNSMSLGRGRSAGVESSCVARAAADRAGLRRGRSRLWARPCSSCRCRAPIPIPAACFVLLLCVYHLRVEGDAAAFALQRLDAFGLVRRRPDGAAASRSRAGGDRRRRRRVDAVHVQGQAAVPALPHGDSAWRPKRSRWWRPVSPTRRSADRPVRSICRSIAKPLVGAIATYFVVNTSLGGRRDCAVVGPELVAGVARRVPVERAKFHGRRQRRRARRGRRPARPSLGGVASPCAGLSDLPHLSRSSSAGSRISAAMCRRPRSCTTRRSRRSARH